MDNNDQIPSDRCSSTTNVNAESLSRRRGATRQQMEQQIRAAATRIAWEKRISLQQQQQQQTKQGGTTTSSIIRRRRRRNRQHLWTMNNFVGFIICLLSSFFSSSSSSLASSFFLLSMVISAAATLTSASTTSSTFNYEVERRVLDRMDAFLNDPVSTNQLFDNLRTNGVFPNNMEAFDRELYLKIAFSLDQLSVYVGLEDGSFPGYYWANGHYREPGNSGYSSTDPSSVMDKHLYTCVDKDDGTEQPCLLDVGATYIQCQGDTEEEIIAGNERGLCYKVELCPNQAPCDDDDDYDELINNTSTKSSMKAVNESLAVCRSNQKWCRQYTIEIANATTTTTSITDDGNTMIIPSSGKGYIPLTKHCHDKRGTFTEGIDNVIDPLAPNRFVTDTLVSCTYGDGVTLVQRNISGPYLGCGKRKDGSTAAAIEATGGVVSIEESDTTSATAATTTTTYPRADAEAEVCNDVFRGGFESTEYDPRYRPWYIRTKELQHPNWSPPYPFFFLAIGVTYSHPIYTYDESTNRQIFAGVLAVDYRFEDIATFLIESYGNTSTAIAIYEEAEPHYLIATSTGSPSARFFLNTDLSVPCPFDRANDTNAPCTAIRTSIGDLASTTGDDGNVNPYDAVLVRTYERQEEEGYPDELVSVIVHVDELGDAYIHDEDNKRNKKRAIKTKAYMSKSAIYEQVEAKLAWRVIIVEPGITSENDAITIGNPLFGVICTIGALGFIACTCFCYFLYARRNEREVVYADWRFTCAFIFGCILLNLSTFTMLGENTNTTCILRMWSYHLPFAIALGPLFVKIWRIQQLVGRTDNAFRRTMISNQRVALYTFAIVVAQTIILLLFTILDPPQRTEIVEHLGGTVLQRVICDRENPKVFWIIVSIYEAGFVVVGCIIAYQTRNLEQGFGEAKQLIFAMYNIAFVGCIIILVYAITDMDGNNTNTLLQSVGIFWVTTFSAASFVVPRLLQVYKKRRSTIGSLQQHQRHYNRQQHHLDTRDSRYGGGGVGIDHSMFSSSEGAGFGTATMITIGNGGRGGNVRISGLNFDDTTVLENSRKGGDGDIGGCIDTSGKGLDGEEKRVDDAGRQPRRLTTTTVPHDKDLSSTFGSNKILRQDGGDRTGMSGEMRSVGDNFGDDFSFQDSVPSETCTPDSSPAPDSIPSEDDDDDNKGDADQQNDPKRDKEKEKEGMQIKQQQDDDEEEVMVVVTTTPPTPQNEIDSEPC